MEACLPRRTRGHFGKGMEMPKRSAAKTLMCVLLLSGLYLFALIQDAYATGIAYWYRDVKSVELQFSMRSDLKQFPIHKGTQRFQEKVRAKVESEVNDFAPEVPIRLATYSRDEVAADVAFSVLKVRISLRMCCEEEGSALGAIVVNVGREELRNTGPVVPWSYALPEPFRIANLGRNVEDAVVSAVIEKLRRELISPLERAKEFESR